MRLFVYLQALPEGHRWGIDVREPSSILANPLPFFPSPRQGLSDRGL